MVHLISYSAQKAENKQIITSVRDTAATVDRQSWECYAYQDAGAAVSRLKEGSVDLISWDVSHSRDRSAIASVRGDCGQAFLLAVADKETSPLDFLTPSINPNSLIIRPLTCSELRRVAQEMIEAVRRQRETEDDSAMLITRRDEQRRILYRHIYYFEARGKKIYARLRSEEIGFHDTLEQLEEALPASFQRCHRSFIVNTTRIERVLLSQNTICLWDGLSVPLSRSFKKAIKEIANNETAHAGNADE